MKYIRSCENCYREIRFPIDKGTLFVTCPYCNSSFKVNPDDPILYSKGRFDLVKINQNQPEEFFLVEILNHHLSRLKNLKVLLS
jgi:DNA-directed RNA polymerase subunit RPC12/RpoP